jgi:hypothetical protein
MAQPANPRIYHIIHVDRLESVMADGGLWCDATIASRPGSGTTIGMSDIKARRLKHELTSRPGLQVGQCVPFYFCPRSVMLYLIDRRNHPNLPYLGGQGPIVHLEADLRRAVEWATSNGKRWAFTLSNAGANYFEDRSDLSRLHEINWQAVEATKWSGSGVDPFLKEGKQAEFLIEEFFPWHLVLRIGVCSPAMKVQVEHALAASGPHPIVEVQTNWYY